MMGRFYLHVLFVALCLASVKGDIDQTSISNGAYTTTGSATVSGGFIQLTSPSASQAGIALYSTQQTIANGFSATFDYAAASCSSPGANGFTFLVSPTITIANSLVSGGALAIVGATNVAVVAFDLYNDYLFVCSTDAVTPLTSASCVNTAIGTELRCTGSHIVTITFSPPSSWQVWLNGNSKGNFTKDLLNTLTMTDNMAYIGFSGSTSALYNMRQRINSWSFTSSGNCSVNNGGCSMDATCAVVGGAVQCTCNEGYTGDGFTCTLVSPPVAAPVAVPVAEPPVEVPVAQPVAVPVAVPASAPVSTPQVAPVTMPVAPPVSAIVSSPTAMPVIVPILECFDDLQNGTFIAYFGYNNTMGRQISLPVGSTNTFGSPSFIGQPTSFNTGRSDYFPNSAFAYLWSGNSLAWTLTSYRLTLDTSDTSRKCPSFARFILTFYTERELNDQEVNAISSGIANALGISPERVRVLSTKYTPVPRKRDLSVAELEMEITAANITQQNEPSAAVAVQTLIETAQNTTALAHALDPTGTSNIQPIGVKSAPTGLEQSGNAVSPTSNEPASKSPRGLVGELNSGAVFVQRLRMLTWFVIFLVSL